MYSLKFIVQMRSITDIFEWGDKFYEYEGFKLREKYVFGELHVRGSPFRLPCHYTTITYLRDLKLVVRPSGGSFVEMLVV